MMFKRRAHYGQKACHVCGGVWPKAITKDVVGAWWWYTRISSANKRHCKRCRIYLEEVVRRNVNDPSIKKKRRDPGNGETPKAGEAATSGA